MNTDDHGWHGFKKDCTENRGFHGRSRISRIKEGLHGGSRVTQKDCVGEKGLVDPFGVTISGHPL